MTSESISPTGIDAGWSSSRQASIQRSRASVVAAAGDLAGSMPPTGLVLLAILSVQCGSAMAKNLFPALGSSGTAYVRILLAAALLLIVRRPRLTGYARADYLWASLFGVDIAIMNASFYAAIDRVPLGVAVTLEFVGPLGVAIMGSRRKLDLLWSALACMGILLLAPWGNTGIDPIGVIFALVAGAGWAGYILLNVRVGRAFLQDSGLVLSLSVAAVVAMPLGIADVRPLAADPGLLALCAGVAVLSTVIPFSLEHAALKRLPAQVFGILMSVEPAVAALIGVVLLHESLSWRALAAMVVVILASVGSSQQSTPGKT